MIIPLTFIATLSFVFLISSSLAYAANNYLLCDWTSLIGWVGITIVFFTVLGKSIEKILVQIVRGLQKKELLPNHSFKIDVITTGHHRLIKYSVNISIFLFSSLLAFQGLYEGLRLPQVKAVNIEIEGLHPDLEGFSIVQISDLHVSPAIRRNWVQDLVKRANSLTPDIIAITGDVNNESYDRIRNDIEPLSKLRARLGNYFVIGNHEYMSGVNEWVRVMRNLGYTVLRNEHRIIRQGDGLVLLGGVDDYGAAMYDTLTSSPTEAMGEDSTTDIKILLAHQPKSVYEASKAGFDIQLSGHTHGGLISPIRWLSSLGQPFQSGLYKYKNTQLYVSNGTGYWGAPLRFGTPSEISLIKLTVARHHN